MPNLPSNCDYLTPFLRTQTVQEVVVSGYTTIRLNTEAALQPSGLDLSVLAIFENMEYGTTAQSVGIQIKQTSDPSSSGARTNIGSAITLVPGGRVTATFTPTQNYVEIWGTGGTSELRAQLASKLSWNIMSFSKTDPFYPPQLWNTNNGVSFTQLGNTGS